MTEAVAHAGSCHCGDTHFLFETIRPLRPRACQCSFCRKHGARMISDPDGRVRLREGRSLTAYRFATGAAAYLFCTRCGTYVGARLDLDAGSLMTVSLNAFDDPHPGLEAEPVSYEGESAEARAARRRALWTPVAS